MMIIAVIELLEVLWAIISFVWPVPFLHFHVLERYGFLSLISS